MCENTYVNIQTGEVLGLEHVVSLKDNAMLRQRPNLWCEWDFEKNDKLGLDIYRVTKSSARIVWWICSKCESNYDMTIDKRTKKRNCPYCAGKRVNNTNSLASLRPELAKQWHPTNNGNMTPHDVTSNNIKEFWWLCHVCNSDYKMKISYNRSDKCPYCLGQRVNSTNSLATLNTSLAKQWHPTKNGDLTPHDVTCNKNKKVWWMCDLGHEWESDISSRNSGVSCPYCANQKVLVGYNSMWDTDPELASLLANPEDGYEYTQGGNEKLNWKCPDCGELLKNKSISNIKNKSISCPVCSDGYSYPEKFIFSLLKQLDIEFYFQKSFKWSKNKIYDFYITFYDKNKETTMSVLLEIHGEQHYRYTGRGRTLDEEQENDKLKEQLAKENGINHYIVIDARESNMNWIKNSVINSDLNTLFNLSNVDWINIEKNSVNSFIKIVCNLWSSGLRSSTLISENVNLGKHTVVKYLKKGEKLGWCDYNADEVMKEVRKYGKKNTKSVVQLSLSDEFIRSWDSMSSARRENNANHISSCVKGIRNKSGGYRWMYLEDYEKQYGKIDE